MARTEEMTRDMSDPRQPAGDPVELLAELVSIDSVNPDLVPGAAGEAAIAGFCGDWLAARGVEVHRLESRAGRPSIVGIARGRGGGRSITLNGHYDTVTLAGYDGDPLAPRIEDGRLHGRGAFDMKSGVAAAMVAAARAARRDLRGDVIVACVADEEHSSWGTEEVLRDFVADAGIVTEPSHLELTLAHKGFVWFDVTILGRAAHGSRPELGIDAIAKSGHFLVALEAWGARLNDGPRHHALGSGSVHTSLIQGGEEASSYPATCRVTIERRTVPGEEAGTVEAELRAILDGLASTVPDFAYHLERGVERTPFEADPSHPLATTLAAHAGKVLGHAPVIRAEPFWTDCALLHAAGIPAVMFGADGGGAHAADEWASIASVRQLTDILTDTVIEFCG
jgi:acetylornithine deacetylase